jgi:hypothetical protein
MRISPTDATHGWLESTLLTHVLPVDEPARRAHGTKSEAVIMMIVSVIELT